MADLFKGTAVASNDLYTGMTDLFTANILLLGCENDENGILFLVLRLTYKEKTISLHIIRKFLDPLYGKLKLCWQSLIILCFTVYL